MCSIKIDKKKRESKGEKPCKQYENRIRTPSVPWNRKIKIRKVDKYNENKFYLLSQQ